MTLQEILDLLAQHEAHEAQESAIVLAARELRDNFGKLKPEYQAVAEARLMKLIGTAQKVADKVADYRAFAPVVTEKEKT